jgi:hypothetical protein
MPREGFGMSENIGYVGWMGMDHLSLAERFSI